MKIYRMHRSARAAGDYAGATAAGQAWLGSAKQLAIQVPSEIIPEEFNVLLNPLDNGYNDLAWSEPRPFRFDLRLFFAEPQML